MKLEVRSAQNEKKGEIELPEQFSEEVNSDLIARAVLAVQSRKRQRYGASPEAGKRASAKVSRRRRDYRGSYGHGISRVPRKVMSRRGIRMNWVGAFAPGTVGGRQAHPPKAKDMEKKINRKEERKAIRSAIAAAMNRQIVSANHKIPDNYPFAASQEVEKISKTKEAVDLLKKFGMQEELKRTSKKVSRAGKGKLRGRKTRTKKGLLIVVADTCGLSKSGRNLPGVDVVAVNKLDAEMLAPGAVPGRPVIFTQTAIERMRKEKIFSK
ncbi:50S ribosomal protein L4 [Candidatus Woesearchaeota archaeon]|nr:50S ribosomal protein L4 [Candidatus Woesearchaeota archaeon]